MPNTPQAVDKIYFRRQGGEEAFALNSGSRTTCNCSAKPQMEELCYVFISRCLFNVRLLCCCRWNRHQQTALINQVSRKRPNQELRNTSTNITAIQWNSGATVAVMTQKFSPSGILWASQQHYNAIFFILVFIFHFYKYSYIKFFCILLKKTKKLSVMLLFFNVARTLCTNMSSFWPSNTSEFQF